MLAAQNIFPDTSSVYAPTLYQVLFRPNDAFYLRRTRF